MAATTGQLGLVTPTQGTLSGTWGDTVNNGITEYTNIAIAGTLSFTGDGAITLANTTGDAAATNITTTTAQYMVIRVTGTLTTPKIITGPSYSKIYLVDNAATGSTVTFKAAGQSGVSVAVGEECFVYYNGTDYIKVASSFVSALSGTLGVANGGTGLTAGTSGGVLAYTASGTLASSGALAANNVVVGGGAGVAPSSTNLLAISAAVTTGNYIKAIGYADTVTALGNTGSAINLDVTSGNVFTATLNQSSTITLRYPVATGSSSFTLILTNGTGGPYTVAWAGGSFKFPGGAASLSRTTTANAVDVWFFFTPDGGTTYYGSIPMKNLTA
jgi:hypothetical protein